MIENPKDYFCNPKRLPNIIIEEPLEEGIYFAVSGGQYKIIIIGKCPNLDNESCRIYPNHPPGCKKIRIDSIHCRQARERHKK
jgi:Fe-S-cluster containining protein